MIIIGKAVSILFALASVISAFFFAFVDVRAIFDYGDVEIVNLILRLLLSTLVVIVLFCLGKILYVVLLGEKATESLDMISDFIFEGGHGIWLSIGAPFVLHVCIALLRVASDFLSFLGSIFH